MPVRGPNPGYAVPDYFALSFRLPCHAMLLQLRTPGSPTAQCPRAVSGWDGEESTLNQRQLQSRLAPRASYPSALTPLHPAFSPLSVSCHSQDFLILRILLPPPLNFPQLLSNYSVLYLLILVRQSISVRTYQRFSLHVGKSIV